MIEVTYYLFGVSTGLIIGIILLINILKDYKNMRKIDEIKAQSNRTLMANVLIIFALIIVGIIVLNS